jgi:hypothetical protein
MSTEAIKAIEAKMQEPKPVIPDVNAKIDAEAVETAPEVVVESTAAAPEMAEDDTEDSATSDGNDSPARQNKGVGKRINELTKNWREKEREALAERQRADELQRRLDELSQGKPQPVAQPTQAAPTGKPTLEECDYDSVLFAEKMAEWVLEERDRKQQAQKQTEERNKRLQSYQQRADAFADEHPDYMEAVGRLQVTPIMEEAIFETEMEPQIAYYLSQNPGEAADIAKLSPAGQVRAIAKLEDKLSAQVQPAKPSIPQPPSVPSPNPPPPSVQAKSPARTPVQAWSLDQHIEAVRAKSTRR